MDWASRHVLAWRLSNTLDAGFCVEALDDALARHGPPEIFNTDQGSQFTSGAFTGRLQAAGIQISMDGRGRCMDNIFIERLWRSLKYEAVYLHELGAVLFSAVLLFQVVTLPVEFNASNRAKALIVEHGIRSSRYRSGREWVDRVLNAAALTYVAAAGEYTADAPVLPLAGGPAWTMLVQRKHSSSSGSGGAVERRPPSIIVLRIPMVFNHIHLKYFSKTG